jgi:hypothetical protein
VFSDLCTDQFSNAIAVTSFAVSIENWETVTLSNKEQAFATSFHKCTQMTLPEFPDSFWSVSDDHNSRFFLFEGVVFILDCSPADGEPLGFYQMTKDCFCSGLAHLPNFLTRQALTPGEVPPLHN